MVFTVWLLFLILRNNLEATDIISWAGFFIIFVSDGKFDNSMGVRKRTD